MPDKKSVCNAGDLGSIPGLGRSREKIRLEKSTVSHSSILAWRIPSTDGNDNSLQCSCLGNPMDRGAMVREIAKSWIRLKN